MGKWTSSNASCATVDMQPDGSASVNALKSGKVILTYSIGKMSAECEVTILPAPTRVALSAQQLQMYVDEPGRSLTATVYAGTAAKTGYYLDWSSDNEAVLTVDRKGNLTALAKGEAVVRAATYLPGVYAEAVVVVHSEPAGAQIMLDGEIIDEALVCKGEKLTLTPDMIDVDGLPIEDASSAPAVWSVESGVGYENVTVLKYAPNADGTYDNYVIVPEVDDGSATTYTFTSSAKAVATVSADGVVTFNEALKTKKTVKITVRTHNAKVATITFTVYPTEQP